MSLSCEESLFSLIRSAINGVCNMQLVYEFAAAYSAEIHWEQVSQCYFVDGHDITGLVGDLVRKYSPVPCGDLKDEDIDPKWRSFLRSSLGEDSEEEKNQVIENIWTNFLETNCQFAS